MQLCCTEFQRFCQYVAYREPIIINSKLEGLPRDLVYDFAKLPLDH